MCDAAAFCPCSVLPTFHARIGFFRGKRFGADFDQPMRVLEPFDIADDDVGLRVVDEIIDEIERADADLVAGGHHLAEVEPARLWTARFITEKPKPPLCDTMLTLPGS